VNDAYDASCNCVGTFSDADGDGVCTADDCDDTDPLIGPIGMTCNDNDPCTINDVFDINCNCAGTFQDTDNDGICDASDSCPNFDNNLVGTPCDDGMLCTVNDTWQPNCLCSGTFMDSDNDGYCDPVDQCPGIADQPSGSACNDNDPCTINDVWVSCGCSGTFQDSDGDGTCDVDDCFPLDPAIVCTLPCPTTLWINNQIPDDHYKAKLWIKSDGSLPSGGDAKMEAGDYIELVPGFEADQNSDLHIYIGGCP